MEYRLLGRTGLRVSVIGFGTWGIGGVTPGQASYGPADDRESLNALAAALDCGITFYDTAGVYGRGHSEELLARAFATQRHRVTIASKVGYVDDFARQDFSAAHVRKSLEGTLRRLQTDYLDLCQLHSPPLDDDTRDALATLEDLAHEGKVRSVGVSVRSPADALTVLEWGVDAIQVNFNLMDQRVRTLGVLDAAARHRTGVIVRTPLASGFLSGPLDVAALDPRDHRTTRSAEQIDRWQRGRELFAALDPHTARTAAQRALQFCLADPRVATTVPGMMRVREVEENVATLTAPRMTESERHAIEALYARQEFFVR